MDHQEPILAVKQLSITFKPHEHASQSLRKQALYDVDMHIYPGELVAIAGISGAGKSLLAHALVGLLPPNAEMQGTILFQGKSLSGKEIECLRGRRIHFIPQGVSYLNPLMKVGSFLSKGKRNPGSQARIETSLDRYGLEKEIMGYYPFELSGGMARRILITAAVMDDPRLVIADEPMPGLHPDVARRALGHFREIADAGAGVMLITHDLELALEVADRVIVLYEGRTIEEACIADFQDPARLRHPYTRALWLAMPKHGFHAPDWKSAPSSMIKGCAFMHICPQAHEDCQGDIPYLPVRGGAVRCIKGGLSEVGVS